MKELKVTPVETASPDTESRQRYEDWENSAGYSSFWDVWQAARADLELELTQVREELRQAKLELAEGKEAHAFIAECLNNEIEELRKSSRGLDDQAKADNATDRADNIRLRGELEQVREELARVDQFRLAAESEVDAQDAEITRLRSELEYQGALFVEKRIESQGFYDEIAEARNEAATCDDILLHQPLAGVINSLQKDRERLQVELGKAEAENKRLHAAAMRFYANRGFHEGGHEFDENVAGCSSCEEAYIAAEADFDNVFGVTGTREDILKQLLALHSSTPKESK